MGENPKVPFDSSDPGEHEPIKPENFDFGYNSTTETGDSARKNRKSSRKVSWKLHIGTTDILILLLFPIVVFAIAMGKLDVRAGILYLLAAGGVLGVSQVSKQKGTSNTDSDKT